jgi:hypothetical protein
MKRTLFFSIVILGVLLLALAGWTVRGLRRAFVPPRRLAPA